MPKKPNIALVEEPTLDFKSIVADSGSGSENVTQDDIKTPFIRIIQALSPQHQKNEPAYIEGSEQGQLFNTVNDKVYSEITIVPVHYEVRHIEKKRKTEGQSTEEFVADHGTDKSIIDGLKKEKFAFVTAEDNLIYPTATEYILTLDKNNVGVPAVLSFPSTLADQSRRLNSKISENRYPPMKNGKIIPGRPPRWYKTFKLSTQIKTKGTNKWYIFKLVESDPLIKINDDGSVSGNNMIPSGISIYKAAKSFHDLIGKGEVELQPMDEEVPAGNTSADKAF